MKERIFTTKEQGRVLIEAGLPISTASGYRSLGIDRIYSMEDNAGHVSLAEAITPDIPNPVWDIGTLLNLFPAKIDGCMFGCYKLKDRWFVSYVSNDNMHIYWSNEQYLIDALFSLMLELIESGLYKP